MTLFEKLDNIQVDSLCLLTEEDKKYCEIILKDYKRLLRFYTETEKQYADAFQAYCSETDGMTTSFITGKDHAAKLLSYWRRYIRKLEEEFVQRIESYFIKAYHLEFPGWEPKEEEENERAEKYQPLTTYEPLIQHITTQTGSDMASAGKQRIIQSFQFYFDGRYTWQQEGAKIVLPGYYTLSRQDGISLSKYDNRVESLFRLLVLHFEKTTSLPATVEQMYEQCKKTLLLNTDYTISQVTIRFFKNANVQIQFPSPEEAQAFFHAYSLQPETEQ